MQSLGNDFVVLDHIKETIKLNKNHIKKISNRNYGIGCDQVLVLEKSSKKDIAFNYKIFNKDGSQVGQCGNGAKCVAKYFFDKYGNQEKKIKIETISSKMTLRYLNRDIFSVEMGAPNLNIINQNLFLYKNKKYFFNSISLGNPHAVFFVKNIKKIDLEDFSIQFNKKKYFNRGVNISIAEIIKANTWKARVYERGSGETEACGSAACAISVCANLYYKKNIKNNYIHMSGGVAHVKWSCLEFDPVYLIGKSDYVFYGTYII